MPPLSHIQIVHPPQHADFRALLPFANYSTECYLVGRDSLLLQAVMVVWRTFLKFEVYQTAIIVSSQEVQIKKSAPNCHYYLQRAVTPDWKGSIAL
jgi:hypothetical protein